MAENRDMEEIFSKSIRAGRRTYFFDVRQTRAEDYYLTITESKRDFNEDGTPFYKKHKIYLYKEDFADFKNALNEVSDYIIKEKGEEIITNTEKKTEDVIENTIETKAIPKPVQEDTERKEKPSTDFTEVNFDDLGKD
jgi:hypothetical protein